MKKLIYNRYAFLLCIFFTISLMFPVTLTANTSVDSCLRLSADIEDYERKFPIVILNSKNLSEATKACFPFEQQDSNPPSIWFSIGRLYLEKHDTSKALFNFNKAAQNGYSAASFYLGLIYMTGTGVDRDIERGIRFLELAADKEHPGASYRLGIFLNENSKFDENTNRIIELFSSSAKHGFAPSQYILGLMYIKGIRMEVNMVKGQNLMLKAAQSGFVLAQFEIAKLIDNGSIIFDIKTNEYSNWYCRAQIAGITEFNGSLGQVPDCK